MKTYLSNKQFDQERALYHLQHAELDHITFAGPADGESSLKECFDISVTDSAFSLRYPLWHTRQFALDHVTMDANTRAALWYAQNGMISHSRLAGIKAVRECKHITINDSYIDSEEFGWKSAHITLNDTRINAAYLFLDSHNITLNNVHMTGKYSFQYVEHLEINDSYLDTKDAFWHANHVVVRNSTIKGEYLGWYSHDLTLINCHIIGTQPLCYCENLTLINCTMEDCDLAFEYSSVQADVVGHVDSIKNPLSGTIIVDAVDEIIREDAVRPCTADIIVRHPASATAHHCICHV